jgi:hypothetical protein
MIGAALLALLGSAQAAETVGVFVQVEGELLPKAAVWSNVFHALKAEHGHTPLFLEDEQSAAQVLAQAYLTTAYRVTVAWNSEALVVDGGVLLGEVPTIDVTEYTLHDGLLHPDRSWAAHGAAALYRVSDGGEDSFVSLPEVALQDAMKVAVEPMAPVVWKVTEPPLLQVPLIVAADEEYRAFYGKDWPREAMRRVNRANELLAPAGLALHATEFEAWNSPDHAKELGQLLEHLADQALREPNLRLGFTQQDLGHRTLDGVESVGRAHMPGRDFVVIDQRMAPGHDPSWDVADEAVAIAHEFLHGLGLPHLSQRHFVMSETKGTAVHVMAPSSISLARAAAQARFAHWDPVVAMRSLAHAAETWLSDEELQIDYIVDNLSVGPGMPGPGAIAPHEASPLANLAMGTHFFSRARTDPTNVALRQSAIAHTLAAAKHRPKQAARLLVVHEQPARAPQPPPTLVLPQPGMCEDFALWDLPHCVE